MELDYFNIFGGAVMGFDDFIDYFLIFEICGHAFLTILLTAFGFFDGAVIRFDGIIDCILIWRFEVMCF